MSHTSPIKTLLLGATAVITVVIAVFVAVSTLSDSSASSQSSQADMITGIWVRAEGAPLSEAPQGIPAELLILKDLVSFDASQVEAGTVTLSTADSTYDGKVLKSMPGYLLLQVKFGNDKEMPVTITQIGRSGTLTVSNTIFSVPCKQQP